MGIYYKIKQNDSSQIENLIPPSIAARRLGVSKTTIYRWFWKGKIKGAKLENGAIRILESAIWDRA